MANRVAFSLQTANTHGVHLLSTKWQLQLEKRNTLLNTRLTVDMMMPVSAMHVFHRML
jgi:hypothetical protein